MRTQLEVPQRQALWGYWVVRSLVVLQSTREQNGLMSESLGIVRGSFDAPLPIPGYADGRPGFPTCAGRQLGGRALRPMRHSCPMPAYAFVRRVASDHGAMSVHICRHRPLCTGHRPYFSAIWLRTGAIVAHGVQRDGDGAS